MDNVQTNSHKNNGEVHPITGHEGSEGEQV